MSKPKFWERKDLKNTFIYFGASVVTSAFGFVTLPYFTKHLTPEEYGIWGYLLGINSFITPLLILSLNSYFIKTYYDPSDQNDSIHHKKVLFTSLLFFCLCWTILLIIFCIIFGSFLFNTFDVSIAFFPYAAILLLSNIAYPIMTFLPLQYRVEHEANKYAVVVIANAIILILLSVLGVILMEDDLLGRVVGYTAGQFLFILLCIPVLRKNIVFEISWDEVKRGIRTCSPLIIPAIISVSYTFIDKIILEHNTSLTELGYYNIAYQYANILWIILLAVYRAFEPTIFELSAKNKIPEINRLISFIFLALFAAGVSLIVASDFIIPILTNNIFNQSIFISKVLTISFIYSAGSILINTYLISILKTRLLFYESIIGLGIFIFLALSLVPEWGATGIAYSRIVLYIILILISWGFIKERRNFWFFIIVSLFAPIIIFLFI